MNNRLTAKERAHHARVNAVFIWLAHHLNDVSQVWVREIKPHRWGWCSPKINPTNGKKSVRRHKNYVIIQPMDRQAGKSTAPAAPGILTRSNIMTVTIHTTGFNVLAHGGFAFRSSNEVAHHITRKEAMTLREQPGYRRGARMSVMFTSSGATRLYVDVGAGNWMDASLRDLGTIEPKRPSTPKWVDVLNAAEPGTAR